LETTKVSGVYSSSEIGSRLDYLMAIENRMQMVVLTILSVLVLLTSAVETATQQVQSDGVEQAFERAVQLHQSGDLEGAVRAYTEILSKSPARSDVRSNLGAAYSGLGRYEDAIEQYKRALSLTGSNEAIRFNLGVAYYKAALFAEAAAELTRFLAVAPKSAQAANAKIISADCNVRLGEYKKVIAALSPIADADPNNRTVTYLLGSALIGDNQVSKGQEIIDRVFRDDDSAEAHLLMGSVLLLADDAQTALKEVQRAIELNPKIPGGQAWYGRVLMRLGDSEKAKIAFKTELASNANDFDANLYIGILLRQDKQLDEALSYLVRATRLRPREQYARYHLAAVYASAGKVTEARPLLEGVLQEHEDFIEARVLLASVYYRLNRKEDGDKEKAIIEQLNAKQQAKQPGARAGGPSSASKPSSTPQNNKLPK
jgi:tetratricopeptide (TPR) repeat protein